MIHTSFTDRYSAEEEYDGDWDDLMSPDDYLDYLDRKLFAKSNGQQYPAWRTTNNYWLMGMGLPQSYPQTNNFFLNMQNFQFSGSSAIADNGITMSDDSQVTVTYNGGRDYTYMVGNPEFFVAALNQTIEESGSVGQFINKARRMGDLTDVTVW